MAAVWLPTKFVISADEKTSTQARRRCHPSLAASPGRAVRIENEYERGGALQYLAAWDVHRAKVFTRCEAKAGIALFSRLVDNVMTHAPVCHGAARLLDRRQRLATPWCCGGQPAAESLPQPPSAAFPDPSLLAEPDRMWFASLARRLLRRGDFTSAEHLEAQILAFIATHNRAFAHPYRWTFTGDPLAA